MKPLSTPVMTERNNPTPTNVGENTSGNVAEICPTSDAMPQEVRILAIRHQRALHFRP